MASHSPQAEVTIAGVDSYAFRAVDSFLQTFAHLDAIKALFQYGFFVDGQACDSESLAHELHTHLSGSQRAQLLESGVIEKRGGSFHWTEQFVGVLRFADLLRTKLEFCLEVFPHPEKLIGVALDEPLMQDAKSRVLRLFDYSLATGAVPGDSHRQHVNRWTRITTGLTRYEAEIGLDHFDCSRFRRVLDVGGNTGEFAFQLCQRQPNLEATVLDLPLVCEAGECHIASLGGCKRLSFVSGDVVASGIPEGYDLVAFKSTLHDWPDTAVRQILSSTAESLPPGGSVLIFERLHSDTPWDNFPVAHLPLALFRDYYRNYEWYTETLAELGFRNLKVVVLHIDLPFALICAQR